MLSNLGMTEQDNRRNRIAATFLAIFAVAGGLYAWLAVLGLDVSELANKVQTEIEALDTAPTYENQASNKQAVYDFDYDHDGLNGELEAMLGSDDNVVDTDGDGYDDYQEFLAFYDPTADSAVLTQEVVHDRVQTFLQTYQWPYTQNAEAWYWLVLADAVRADGNDDRASVYYERSLSIEPSSDAYWSAYYTYADAKQYERARDVVNRFLRDFSDDWGGYYQRGNLDQRLERLDTVQADYDTALAMGADYVWLYNNYGALLSNRGEDQAALEMYIKAIQLEANHPLIEENIAAVLRNLGKEDEARQHEELANQLRAQGIEL